MKTKTDKLYLTSNKKIFIIQHIYTCIILCKPFSDYFVHVYILCFIILAIIVNFYKFFQNIMLKNCTHVLDHFYRQLCCIKLYRNIIIFLFQNFQGSAGAAGSKGDTGVPGPQGYPGPPGPIIALPTPGGPDAGPLDVGHVRKSLIKLAHFDHTCHSIIPNPLLEIQRAPPPTRGHT